MLVGQMWQNIQHEQWLDTVVSCSRVGSSSSHVLAWILTWCELGYESCLNSEEVLLRPRLSVVYRMVVVETKGNTR